jgi:AcrR family transcriptional regulator
VVNEIDFTFERRDKEMFSKFLSIDTEKQTKILNAAIKQFAQKGYKNASTNEIVKEAEISKGLLFHYFKNKKELYLFVYDYCIEVLINDFYNKINLSESDIIVRLRQFALVKLKMLERYPDIIRFVEVAYMEDSVDVKNEVEERKNRLINNNLGKAFEGIDVSKFKEGMDVEKAINIIVWTFEGISGTEIKKAKLTSSGEIDYKKIFDEADVYIDMFKKWFYK